jgi:arylsulfatase A-like enzyme
VNPWDQHGKLAEGHADMAHQVDQPIAALLTDLKERGLLESTIVIFSGEFGRTPFAQGSDGRDHNPYGFSLWVAGGGFKGGLIHGATDDFGYHAVESPVSVYDLWATVQHQLGIRHEDLTYLFGGRYFRLSDIEGRVVKPLIS